MNDPKIFSYDFWHLWSVNDKGFALADPDDDGLLKSEHLMRKMVRVVSPPNEVSWWRKLLNKIRSEAPVSEPSVISSSDDYLFEPLTKEDLNWRPRTIVSEKGLAFLNRIKKLSYEQILTDIDRSWDWGHGLLQAALTCQWYGPLNADKYWGADNYMQSRLGMISLGWLAKTTSTDLWNNSRDAVEVTTLGWEILNWIAARHADKLLEKVLLNWNNYGQNQYWNNFDQNKNKVEVLAKLLPSIPKVECAWILSQVDTESALAISTIMKNIDNEKPHTKAPSSKTPDNTQDNHKFAVSSPAELAA